MMQGPQKPFRIEVVEGKKRSTDNTERADAAADCC